MSTQTNARVTATVILAGAALTTWALIGPSGGARADHRPGHNPPGQGGGGDGDGDTISPDAVGDLAAAPAAYGSIVLAWTAVGDDGGGTGCSGAGSAQVYDVRYSTSPIVTDADFEAATPAIGEPEPASCGSGETFCLSGLEPGLLYDIALRVEDEAGNVSDLSNVATGDPGATLGVLVHVAGVQTSWSLAGGPKRRPHAYVWVEDELEAPVEGAIVTGDFGGCTSDPGFSAVTGCTGLALVQARHVAQCLRGGDQDCCFVFTVTGVEHDLLVYDSSANTVNCDAYPCNLLVGGPCDPCEP